MGLLVNKKQLAEILGRNEATLTTWQRDGLPIETKGGRGSWNRYDTADVINWLVKRDVEKRIKKHAGETEWHDYEKERARLTYHQANKISLEEQVLKGELIPVDKVVQVQGSMVSAFRARCLSIPTKTAHNLLSLTDLNEVKSILKTEIFEALAELADFEPEQYDIVQAETDNGASSPAT